MNTKCLLPLAFFALFVSNVFAQNCNLVMDSIAFEIDTTTNCATLIPYLSGGEEPYASYIVTTNFPSTSLIICTEGEYCLSITDSLGCSLVSCFLYQQVATGVQFQIDSIDYAAEFCEGDCHSASVYIRGGEAPYEFNWSDGTQSNNGYFEYCSGGEYAVTVTDANGDMVVDSFEIVEHPALSLSVKSSVGCDGLYFVLINGSGGVPPYEYRWDHGESNTTNTYEDVTQGTYKVVVRDSIGCWILIFADLPEFDTLEVDVTVSENTAMATASNGTPPYTYQWNDPNMQTTATATDLEGGVYNVTITDASGCEVVGTVELLVGIDTPEYLTDFDIFPNPSNGKFTIDLQFEVAQTITIQIFNTLGQEMYYFTDTHSHFRQNIDIHDADAGTYFVVISTESGQVVRRVILM